MHNLMTFSTTHAHKDANVGKVAANKSEYYNPNHFNISYLETLNPLHFLVSHYAIDYLDRCFDHLITLFSNLNWLKMRSKVEFVYNILSFVCNCTLN